MDPARYLRFQFEKGGRIPPAVDCWGLYRTIVAEHTGVELADVAGVEKPIQVARLFGASAESPEWVPVQAGEERPLDLVLMRGVVGSGRAALSAPMHVGCVVEPGLMIDIEETTGVMVRAYRTTARRPAFPTVVNRVLGVYRPAALVTS